MTTVNFMDAVNAYANAGRMAEAEGAARPRDGHGRELRRHAAQAPPTASSTRIAQGEHASLQAATGKADLAQVTEAVSNAEVAVQTVVALRDRVVQAYQDIMRMPI